MSDTEFYGRLMRAGRKFPIEERYTVGDVTYRCEVTLLDGEAVRYLFCPGCGQRGLIDEDQFFGRVSIECEACGWHETVAIAR